MAARRWYITVSARADEDLGAKVIEQDRVARDTGYTRVQAGNRKQLADVESIDLIYEEAPRDSALADRAAALGTSRQGPPATFMVLLIVVLFVVIGIAMAQGQL